MQVYDAQVHLWDGATPRRLKSETTLVNVADTMGSAAWTFFDEHVLPYEVFVEQMGSAGVAGALVVTPTIYSTNFYSLSASRAWPDRYRVVGTVDEDRPDIEDVMSAWLDQPGMVGVRLTVLDAAARVALEAGAYDAMIRGARPGGVPVCVLAPNCAEGLAQLAGRFDDVTFVIDHLGLLPDPYRPGNSAALESLPDITAILAGIPNLYMKMGNLPALSSQGAPYTDLWPHVYPVIEAFGADRVMWASDHSWYPDLSYKEHVDMVRCNDNISVSDREWLLGKTLRRVFQWW
jgi:L-fuconolactonase